REVRQMKAQGKPIINMGIGSPDLAPSELVVNEMKRSMSDRGAHQYQSYQGLPKLREAIADFYENRFSVALNPNTGVLPLMGSKEGIMHISMAFLNQGDGVLIPNPGYPTYTSVTKLVGAQPVYYDLWEGDGWFPDLDRLGRENMGNIKLMWVNYPHMPTGARASKEQLEELVAFAREHQILLVNDNPYSFILNQEPLSLLGLEGAKEVALELNSLSKTFNMAGWRVGMVVGREEYISAILRVKSNMDSGMFHGIQKGAIAALHCGDTWYRELNEVYATRRQLMFKLATTLHCSFDRNTAGMFVWAKLPPGVPSSEEFIDNLLHDKHIFVAPGTIFGSQGEGYIRFSLCVKEAEIEEAIGRI
ncbi:MAG: pyridoxal phosphate-dependent aminotransferase, partial [Flavobacteriaceae bacterium]